MEKGDASTIDEVFANVRLIEKVLQRAVQEALRRHKQTGNPIATWRDGKVVWIPPEEIPLPPDRDAAGTVEEGIP
jgi:hypothetical protein